MIREDISSIRMTVGHWGHVRAYADVTFTNGLTLRSLQVREGNKGLWVALPQRTTYDKEKDEYSREPACRFSENDDYYLFRDIVLERYEEEINRNKSASTAEENTESFVDEDDIY